jgi:hypothetical protein
LQDELLALSYPSQRIVTNQADWIHAMRVLLCVSFFLPQSRKPSLFNPPKYLLCLCFAALASEHPNN